MKKSLVISAILVAGILTLVKPSFADNYGCSGQYGQYGGCPPAQSIMIDKTVAKADNGSVFVDNLSPSDAHFKANDYVTFQLKVKNTSSATENNIKVVDYIPSYLDPVEGPGSFDSSARTITFYIDQLSANEEKSFIIKMQVKSQDSLTSGVACELNKASASVNSAYDEDTAQFCTEKGTSTTITGVTQVPSTGAEDLPILVASFSALGAGIFLKKKAKIK